MTELFETAPKSSYADSAEIPVPIDVRTVRIFKSSISATGVSRSHEKDDFCQTLYLSGWKGFYNFAPGWLFASGFLILVLWRDTSFLSFIDVDVIPLSDSVSVNTGDELSHLSPFRQVVDLCRLSKCTIYHLCFGFCLQIFT